MATEATQHTIDNVSGHRISTLLRDVAEERELGDTTTLADPTVVAEIKERAATESREE